MALFMFRSTLHSKSYWLLYIVTYNNLVQSNAKTWKTVGGWRHPTKILRVRIRVQTQKRNVWILKNNWFNPPMNHRINSIPNYAPKPFPKFIILGKALLFRNIIFFLQLLILSQNQQVHEELNDDPFMMAPFPARVQNIFFLFQDSNQNKPFTCIWVAGMKCFITLASSLPCSSSITWSIFFSTVSHQKNYLRKESF